MPSTPKSNKGASTTFGSTGQPFVRWAGGVGADGAVPDDGGGSPAAGHGPGVVPAGDIKLVVLLQEVLRHCQVLGSWGSETITFENTGIRPGEPGIVSASKVARPFRDELVAALGLHRARAGAGSIMASAVAPAG